MAGKRLRGLILAAAVLLGAAGPAPPERAAILDALRPAVERRLGRPVEFVVLLLRVEADWAFVVVDPQRPGGRPIDGYRIFGKHFGNMDGLRVEGVLRHRNGRWRLVDHGIGATDVWYCDVGPRRLKRGWGC